MLPLRFVVRRSRAGSEPFELRLEAFGRWLVWSAEEPPGLDPARPVALREVPDAPFRAALRTGWDLGSYRPVGRGDAPPSRATVESLRRGRLVLWLEGERLRGGFRLERGREGWRLTKLADAHAVAGATPPANSDDVPPPARRERPSRTGTLDL